MRKTKKPAASGLKKATEPTHKTPAVPAPDKSASPVLKAGSLSDLRKLQQQASKLAGAADGAKARSSAGSSTLAEGSSASTSTRKRPHRFIPPGSGPVLPRAASETRPLRRDGDGTLPTHSASRSMPSQSTAAVSSEGTARAPSPDASLSHDDIALFRRVVESVTPSGGDDRVQLPPTSSATPAQLALRRQHAMGRPAKSAATVSDHYTSAQLEQDSTAFLRAGHGPDLLKGLRRGKWPIDANLDLHGSTLDNARDRLDRFVQSCRDHEIRCVRVVHGKGHGSKNGDPVLKDTVRRWLSQLEVVQAWVECDEANGGAGAVLALLEKQKQAS